MQRSEMTFKKGAILHKEMLTDLYEYPRFAMENYYDSYTDGILYGMEWKESREKKGHHIITPGALKFHGNIYFQTAPLDVEETENARGEMELDGKYRLFFMEKGGPYREPSRMVYELELVAVQSSGIDEAREKGFYYSYVEWQGGERGLCVIEDKKELYGLYAGNDGYGYRLPAAALEKRLLFVLQDKKSRHPLEYEFLRNIYMREGIAVSIALVYLRDYYAETGQDGKDGSGLEETAVNPIELLGLLEEACVKYEMKGIPAVIPGKTADKGTGRGEIWSPRPGGLL